MKVKSLSHVRLLATQWTAAYQAPPSMGFASQENWSGMPLPSPNFPYYNIQWIYSFLSFFLFFFFFLTFVLFTVLWTSWICGFLMPFIICGKCWFIKFSNIFYCFVSLFIFWDSNCVHVRHLILCARSWVLCPDCFLLLFGLFPYTLFFFVCFSLGNFHQFKFMFMDSFLSCFVYW